MRLVGGQPRPRGVRVAEPAADEHLRDRVADAELALEPQDVGDAAARRRAGDGLGGGAGRAVGGAAPASIDAT